MKNERYCHLGFEEREYINLELLRGMSLRTIASSLGRTPSTISREVRRNRQGKTYSYRACVAEGLAQARACQPRRRCKLGSAWLWRYVERRLRQGWSPEQIAGRLKQDYAQDMSKQVSPETIYAALYVMPRGALRRQLLTCLRQAHKRRRPRSRGQDRRGQIPNMISIHARPAEVVGRLVPGHWEGDLVKGAANRSAMGTLVERQSSLTVLVRLNGTTADAARRGFARKLKRVPAPLRKTLTDDRGKEMAEHERLSEQIKLQVYFADPHSPWQRATCENTNGLLRQYYPKGTDFTAVTQRELNRVAHLLNTRPRKGLAFATPLEVYQQAVSVALGN